MRNRFIAGLLAGPIALALALSAQPASAEKVGAETVEVTGVVAVGAEDANGNKVVTIAAEKDTYVVKTHPKRPELVERLKGVHGGHVRVKGKVTVTETGRELVLGEIVEVKKK